MRFPFSAACCRALSSVFCLMPAPIPNQAVQQVHKDRAMRSILLGALIRLAHQAVSLHP